MIELFGLKFSSKMVFLGIGVFGPLLAFIERYVYSDWIMLIPLAILFAFDTMFGIWKALRLKKFNKDHFCYKFLTKLAVYFAWVILLGTMQKFAATGSMRFLSDWITGGGITVLIMREALSLGENLLAIRPDSKLKKIVDRLNKFFQDDKNIDDAGNSGQPVQLLQQQEDQGQQPSEG